MKAEDKLAEAKYFLKKLHKSNESELPFNLSAFIQAWRSVFDVLLYDYAEQYFGYGEARKFRITKNSFREIANVLENHGNSNPRKFIDWYQKKESELAQLHFWHLRKFFVHRGGKTLKTGTRDKKTIATIPTEVYAPPSAVSGDTIPPTAVYVLDEIIEVKSEKELTIAGMPDARARARVRVNLAMYNEFCIANTNWIANEIFSCFNVHPNNSQLISKYSLEDNYHMNLLDHVLICSPYLLGIYHN